MPLADFPDQEVYVRRTREHMAAFTRQPTDTIFNARVRPFKDVYQNIQATEMTNFDMPDDLLANVFVEQVSGFTGNSKLDIRLTKTDFTDTITFTTDMPTEETFVSFEIMNQRVVDEIILAMDAQGDAFFNSANFVFEPPTASVPPSTLLMGTFGLNVAAGPSAIYIEFLFGTGANVGRDPAVALGFEPGIDSAPGEDGIGPVRLGYARLARYVDVKLLQNNNISTQNTILGRIFLPLDGNYKQSRQVVSKARLFTDPVRRSELPRVLLLPAANRSPPPIAKDGWNITTDMLAISPEVVLPNWVNQSFIN